MITKALDFLQSLQVPHNYFTQFYVVSVMSSIFWLAQLLLRGSLFQTVADRISSEHLQSSMSMNQVLLCWVLMVVHSSRRLAECLLFTKPSTSRMWFVHWLLGLAFYLAATVAIWIEGAGKMKQLQGHRYTRNLQTDDDAFARSYPIPRAHFRGSQDHQRPLHAYLHLPPLILASIRSPA